MVLASCEHLVISLTPQAALGFELKLLIAHARIALRKRNVKLSAVAYLHELRNLNLHLVVIDCRVS
jgi:hypothetical protein